MMRILNLFKSCFKGNEVLNKLFTKHKYNSKKTRSQNVQISLSSFCYSSQPKCHRYGWQVCPLMGNNKLGAKQYSSLMLSYQTRGTPWTIIIDKNGIIRYNNFTIEVKDAIVLVDKLLK